MARRLTFPLSALAPVSTGAKCASIRFSKSAAALGEGDRLVLQFGAYNRPTCLETAVRQVVTLDLEVELTRCFTLPEWVQSLADERRFYAQPLEPDDRTPELLLEALRDSGGEYESVLLEAAERMVTSCVCVWWTLK